MEEWKKGQWEERRDCRERRGGRGVVGGEGQ